MRIQLAISFCAGLLFLAGAPVAKLKAQQGSSYAGTWQLPDKSSELVVEQTGDTLHVKEQRGAEVLCEYTCNSNGKSCDFREGGKKSKVSVYFNGPILVEIRTRGESITKRRFGLKDDGKTLEVETMPISPPGKTETVLYARH